MLRRSQRPRAVDARTHHIRINILTYTYHNIPTCLHHVLTHQQNVLPDQQFSESDLKKLEGKGICIQSVRDLVRQYDKLAVGSGSFERVGDRAVVKGSGSSEHVGNVLFMKGILRTMIVLQIWAETVTHMIQVVQLMTVWTVGAMATTIDSKDDNNKTTIDVHKSCNQ